MRRLVAAFVVILVGLPALARAQSPRPFNPRTPEAMARGNVAVGVGGDYGALFYNPAGLTGVDNLELQAVGIMIDTNKGTAGFIKDASNATALSAPGIIATNAGKPMFLRSDEISYLTLKHLGFGMGVALVYDSTVEQAIKVLPAPLLATRKTTDVGGVAGVSYDVIEKWLSVGASLKAFERWYVNDPETPASLVSAGGFDGTIITPFGDCAKMAASGKCQYSKRFGAGVDLGGMFMVPFERLVPGGGEIPGIAGSRIQLGAVYQDVGKTRLGSAGDIPQTVDVGLAWIQSFGLGNAKVGVDFRDLDRSQMPMKYKTSLGGEIEFKELLTLRAGMNDMGGSAGLALRLWMFRLQGGWYQEVSEFQKFYGTTRRDNRFFGQLGFGWYN